MDSWWWACIVTIEWGTFTAGAGWLSQYESFRCAGPLIRNHFNEEWSCESCAITWAAWKGPLVRQVWNAPVVAKEIDLSKGKAVWTQQTGYFHRWVLEPLLAWQTALEGLVPLVACSCLFQVVVPICTICFLGIVFYSLSLEVWQLLDSWIVICVMWIF